MPDTLKTKHIDAPVIKSADLPDDVRKAAEGEDVDLWVYSTVEAEDRDGDIVRVSGIDTAAFAQNGPIKFIMSHNRSPLADGRWPVLGKVVKWVPTTHKALNLPAMATGIKFAPTPLGEETKKLYEGGFLTDVSIGFKPVEATPRKGGGYDYVKSSIAELSACVTGANQFAGVLRAFDAETGTDPKFTDQQLEQIKSLLQPILTRLDDIECAVEVAKADDARQPSDSTPAPAARDDAKANALRDLLDAAGRLGLK